MNILSRSLLSFTSLLLSLALGWNVHPSPARSAEILTLRLGLLQKSVPISELEAFVRTGQITPNLELYRGILTDDIREVLQKHLQVDRRIARQFLEDLFQEKDGERLLSQLGAVLPDNNPDKLKETFVNILEKPEKINLFSFLQAYPNQRLTLDLVALASIAVRLNRKNWQNTLIGSSLTRSLPTTEGTSLPASISPHQHGDSPVFKQDRVFYDSIRKRPIRADIYYSPETRGPLVIMSHGFAADRRFLRYLAYHLASQGLTVVAIEHPGSNIDSLVRAATGFKLDNILPAKEFVERPRDISFVINELTGLNEIGSELAGKFNTERVTIIGHSFGGYTALALAGARLHPASARAACARLAPLERSPADWLQCSAAALPYKQISLRDHRITRAIVLNPLIGDLFAGDLSSIAIPTLMLSSTGDGITPIAEHQLQPFERLGGEKYLLIADGATHMSVTDLVYLDSAMGQSTLVQEVMDEQADPLRKLLAGISYAFIQQSAPDREIYRPFLSSAYAESFSTDRLQFRFTRQLPTPIAAVLTVLSVDRPKIRPDSPLSSPGWLEESWNSIGAWFVPRDFRTEKLSAVFGELLRHSDGTFDPWG
jgi:predicted dienelactone hydrolase